MGLVSESAGNIERDLPPFKDWRASARHSISGPAGSQAHKSRSDLGSCRTRPTSGETGRANWPVLRSTLELARLSSPAVHDGRGCYPLGAGCDRAGYNRLSLPQKPPVLAATVRCGRSDQMRLRLRGAGRDETKRPANVWDVAGRDRSRTDGFGNRRRAGSLN